MIDGVCTVSVHYTQSDKWQGHSMEFAEAKDWCARVISRGFIDAIRLRTNTQSWTWDLSNGWVLA